LGINITIITVVLNQVERLEETIKSVLAQDRADLDYIIVDGASTDGTTELVEKFSGRLKCWISEEDKGVYDAMNKGWGLADPESWILFLGAGDRLISLPEKLPPIGGREIIYGDVSLHNDQVFYSSANFKLKLFNTLHHQALLIPKWLHPQPPFNLEYDHYADFDFNQRLYKERVAFHYNSQLRSYASPGGLTENLVLDELNRVVYKNFGFFWARISVFGFLIARYFPLMRKFRPIRKGVSSHKFLGR